MENKELIALTSIALTACGGGSDGGTNNTNTGISNGYAYSKPTTREEASRFLLQAQFSATQSEIDTVLALGYKSWLEQEANKQISIKGFDWLNQKGYNDININTNYYDNSYPADDMMWHQLITSNDGLRKRIALALSEFFVISTTGLDFSWRSHAVAAWWDMLNKNSFGNFKTLLEEVTLNPAMGFYLNTKGNLKENTSTGRLPDENYSREVMQLFTIGLHNLNIDGTEKLDGSGNKIESYTQSDVTNLARVFTGWDFDQSQNVNTIVYPVGGSSRNIPNTIFTRLPMSFNANNHSKLEVNFLNSNIPENTDGKVALGMAINTLFNHENVAPFFCKQMIQRLVTSNPSKEYVTRVSQVFNNNGSGVRGDLKSVFFAILLDNEARDPAKAKTNDFGKVREPMIRFVQWAKTFGCTSTYGYWKIFDRSSTTSLGQSPLRSPSVFNFFRPGYVPPSTALSATKTPAPEFQIVNESTVSGYLNFMQGVTRNGIYVNAPDVPNLISNANNGFEIKASYTVELGLVLQPLDLVNHLNLVLCSGTLTDANKTLIVNAISTPVLNASSTINAKLDRIASAIFLIMASSDYIVQK